MHLQDLSTSLKYAWSKDCPFPKGCRVKSQEESTGGSWAQPLLPHKLQQLEMTRAQMVWCWLTARVNQAHLHQKAEGACEVAAVRRQQLTPLTRPPKGGG